MNKNFLNLVSLLTLLAVTNSAFATQDYWPTKEWKTKSLQSAGIDQFKFNKLLNFIWDPKAKYKTDVFMIIKDGYIVYEGYGRGHHKNKKHMFWSFSKSLTNILMGIAVKKDIVKLNDPVMKYYPEMNREKAKNVKLEHVLNMSSGLKYFEEHPANIILSDAIYVHYSKPNWKDIALSITKRKMKHRPGEKFNYGTHEPILAMGILKKAMNSTQAYNDFPWTELFDKLNMKSITFEQDKSGTFVGGSGGWGTARDYAKLGLLMLNNGQWENEQILPDNWVQWSTKRIAPSLFNAKKERKERRLNREAYGSYWWLNYKLPMNKHRPYPNAPEDLYQAMGFRGQTLGVIPSMDLIVLRMGSDGRKPKTKVKRDKMYKLLFDSMGKNFNPNNNKRKKGEY
ncbi:MAG: serine hydrolase [Bacteriovoracaceae bacterium]|nr:serine hydrolase [Bacteriovoracaceae bacterium]